MRLTIISFIFLSIISWCNPLWAKAKDEKETKPKLSFSPVTQAFCNKMEECAQGEKIPLAECLKQMNQTFDQSYVSLLPAQRPELSEQIINGCSETVQKLSCAELKTADKLIGCEFIEKLNKK
jgi:hypothetical protein